MDVARKGKSGAGMARMLRLLKAPGAARPPLHRRFLQGRTTDDRADCEYPDVPGSATWPRTPPPKDEGERLAKLAHQLQLTVTDFVAEVHDTHHPVASGLYYQDQKKEARRRAADFLKHRVPRYFDYFEDLLARNSRSGRYTVGARLSYVDLSLFQLVAGMSYAFPNATSKVARTHRRLFALHARIQERPRIGAYLASPRRIPFNTDGIFRHYPELDIA